MKPDLLNEQVVRDLTEAHYKDREDISPKEIRQATQQVLLNIEAQLNFAYELTYLEIKRYCDDFHDGKRSLGDLGEAYGVLSSYVEKPGGSISARFQLRRPKLGGGFSKKNLNKDSKEGYAERTLRRHAQSHEGELAVMTEEHYVRLREQGKKIKETRRKLRTIKLFPK